MHNIEQILKENNAMLKVMMKRQAMIIVILEEAVDKLNDDFTQMKDKKMLSKIHDIRSRLADNLYKQMILETKYLTASAN